ncbi:Transposase IS116/IS110/IS902 family protein [Marinitoga hydrogenitolerans DSM 16785]|uniref:Transposase IS116/IS110/IS902 family protein n=1 Tax=Marinitoga hydrogenitolerans (strain DSM 16785 / JCM 12826 / AT1271) TaxID=1122195 RepID=A0A1M5AP66_MARH1|nr:transposase [Marinitoga hydrogenitolerans]SHF31965.1 Transposase IS116/IS110/IS902 family protein [Marinitoga hydrogenitolerans DSM 16785]
MNIQNEYFDGNNSNNNKYDDNKNNYNHGDNINKEKIDKENPYYQAYKAIITIPGSGELVTPLTIISEIGNISRFESKKHFVSYIGLDPTISQSGKYRKNKKI